MSNISMEKFYQLFLSSKGVCTDTRKVEENHFFVALKGPNFNGNQFVQSALDLGASVVIVDEEVEINSDKIYRVENGLIFLQNLAQYHRRKLDIPFLAITGSNGKTTTKELVFAVLSKKYKTFATKGNFNNHIGVPLTLLSITSDIEIAVIEMGANHVKELEELCLICEPTHGMITNIGLDHLEGYGSIEGVAQGASELYYYLLKNNKIALVNAQDQWLMRMASRFENILLYGVAQNTLASTIISKNDGFLKLVDEQNNLITTQLIGEYNQDNINTALAFGTLFGVERLKSIEAIENYIPGNNRSQLIQKEEKIIFLDAYNANPSSVEKAIINLSNQSLEPKIAILGDMYELGDHSNDQHLAILRLLKKHSIKGLLCGQEYNKHKNEFSNFNFFVDIEDLKSYLNLKSIPKGVFLIKGSRGMAMERVVDYL